MEIIEKKVEKVKEVPYGYWDNYGYGYGRNNYGRGYVDAYEIGRDKFASKGVAGTGLGLGIAGTALGLLALGKNGGGLNLFGNGSNSGMPQNVNINTDNSGRGSDWANGINAPSAFQVWEKSCDDAIALTNTIWGLRVDGMNANLAARNQDVAEKFSLYKSQVDSDFGLYKSARDGFDALTAKQNQDAFALYKNQRDSFDVLAKRISDLETKQAVADAVEPWRAKVLDMRINGVAAAASAGINLEAERRCCADNKIVNYLNSNFYPIEVADLTVGTTATARTTSNPLCGCCGSCGGNQ